MTETVLEFTINLNLIYLAECTLIVLRSLGIFYHQSDPGLGWMEFSMQLYSVPLASC